VFIKQLYAVLKLFYNFTKYVSQGQPTITTSTTIYFKLSKLLKAVSAREGVYATYSKVITDAVYSSLACFKKYYTTIDQNIIYYIAFVLDP
jgi:hypothetical protein